MKFDSNKAWQNATVAISANREVVVALAGVFFLLPGLVGALLFPPPEPVGALDTRVAMATMSDYYISILPWLLPMVLFQAVGTLALLTLLTDRSRPTVREAIRRGIGGIATYVLAQIILGAGIGVIGGLVLLFASAAGAAFVTAAGVALVIALIAVAAIRTSLVAPVVAVEGERNPIAALRRSWLLTGGNAARLAMFYLLVLAAFLVVTMVLTAVLGIVAAAIGGPQAAELTGAVVSSLLNAALALCFVAIVAAAHRQVAGAST